MALAIDRNNTRTTLDCMQQPGGITGFLNWLARNETKRKALDEVNIEYNSRKYPHNDHADINVCQLYHILELLPAVETLHIHGMVFVPCNLCGHGPGMYHTPRPASPQLTSLHLTSIAIRHPFTLDPLRLTTIGPAIKLLYMSEWWALPHSRRVSPLEMALCHPQAELGPPLSVEQTLVNFEVIFPSTVDRLRFRATTNWYDFTRRLPSHRGTRNLTLKDIDGVAASTVISIIADDAATLETLDLGFVQDFQSMLP